MARLKLTLEYEGTAYVGWQVQPNGRSVQSVVEGALAKLLGAEVRVQVAGRTDSGVHALGQVVAFDSPRALPLKAYRDGVNALLPDDVAVVSAEEVPEGFDPRRSASGKHYRYLISNRPVRAPLRRLTHWEIYRRLALEPMRGAAERLVGHHDYSAFRAADCQAKHAVREVRRLDVTGSPGDALEVHVEGTAFLKHMVRNLVGTLVQVGLGKQPPEWAGEVLASRDRTSAGPTAPAHGLALVQVFYAGRPSEPTEDDD